MHKKSGYNGIVLEDIWTLFIGASAGVLTANRINYSQSIFDPSKSKNHLSTRGCYPIMQSRETAGDWRWNSFNLFPRKLPAWVR